MKSLIKYHTGPGYCQVTMEFRESSYVCYDIETQKCQYEIEIISWSIVDDF